jgi:rubredoxin
MPDLNCYCPICHGKVLFHDETTSTDKSTGQPLIPDKLYCPHCEMLVAPEVVPVAAGADFEAAHSKIDAATENRGRSRQGGSNGGGSQRGDLSDQGGSQWRVDPMEGERNTWSDKD